MTSAARMDEKLIRAMRRAEKKMAPHMDKYQSINGMMANLMVIGIAMSVADDKEPRASLNAAVKQASTASGIPLDVMRAQADMHLLAARISKKSGDQKSRMPGAVI